MRAARSVVVFALLLALAGCAPDTAPIAAVAAPVQRQAGSWTMERQVIAYDATGITGQMAGTVAAGKAAVGTRDMGGPVCLTEETVVDDDLLARLHEAIQFGPEWKIERSEQRESNVDFAATFESVDQGSARMTIIGTITPSLTDLTVVSSSRPPGGGSGQVTTTMHVRNERVGDCTPGEDTFG